MQWNFKNLVLDQAKKAQLKRYYQLLVEHNQKFNLTRIIEEKDVYYKHFYDALLLSEEMVLFDQNICDVGSGMGVPGIVLKICFPNLHLTLIEANNKKCQFLQLVVAELQLTNTFVVQQRVEIFAHQYREVFDLVVVRAVASLNILNELCLPLVKLSGFFVAYKGLNVSSELTNIDQGLKLIGAKLVKQTNYQLPENYGTRNLLFFQKTKLTPLKYPRNYQQIKNKPL